MENLEQDGQVKTGARTVRSFRNSQEVETFFRFIHEHNLRFEAKRMLEVVMEKITPPKRTRKQKLQ